MPPFHLPPNAKKLLCPLSQHHSSQETHKLLRYPNSSEVNSTAGEPGNGLRRSASNVLVIFPIKGAFSLHQEMKLRCRAEDRAENQQEEGGKERWAAKLFFIWRTSSSSQITSLIAIDMTKPNFLAWAWLFVFCFKSRTEECMSFRIVSVSPVLSVHEAPAWSWSNLPRSTSGYMGSGSAHLGRGTECCRRPGMEGFSWCKASLLGALFCHSLRLRSFFTLLCVCTYAVSCVSAVGPHD